MSAGDLKGKTVLLTGASSGIGCATAVELARRGARLALAARREDRLRQVADQVRALGARVFALPTDVAERSQVEQWVAGAVAEFGAADVLINNAGRGLRSPLEETTPEEYRGLLAVNLLGPLHAIQAVLPHMKTRGSGHIINISSVAGNRALPQSGAYSSTKFALNGMSEALRLELRPHGIQVSLVLPVSTETEFFAVASRSADRPARPVGPVQPPERVARAIAACILRPRPEVYTHPLARLIHVLNAAAPSLIDAYTARFLTVR